MDILRQYAGYYQAGFRPNGWLLICFNCWRHGHNHKLRHSESLSESFGVIDHTTLDYNIDSVTMIIAPGTDGDRKVRNYQPITFQVLISAMSTCWSLSD